MAWTTQRFQLDWHSQNYRRASEYADTDLGRFVASNFGPVSPNSYTAGFRAEGKDEVTHFGEFFDSLDAAKDFCEAEYRRLAAAAAPGWGV